MGIVLTIVGVIIFLSNVKVSSFTFFYRYHDTNVTAILLIIMCILVVAYVVYPGFVTGILLGIAFLAFIITIIMSMNFYIMHISALEVVLILGTISVGIGLTLRGIVHAKDDLPDDKDK